MEAIVALAILVLLAALAARFGYDSRDGMQTKEYDLAASGMTWARREEPPSAGADVRHAPLAIADPSPRLAGRAPSIEAAAKAS